MKRINLLLVVLGLFWAAALNGQKQLIDWVNPFIGTSNYGATHPGAVMPTGMVSVVPFNVAFKKGEGNKFEKDSEWHSRPYVFENTFFTGFSHVNLSGVGCPDLGSIILMPTTGDLEFDAEKHGSTISNEKAVPGNYKCTVDKYGVDVSVTADMRSGFSQFTFPAGKANLLLNLGLGLTNETGAALKVLSENEVEGYKMIGTFCYHPEDVRPVYFYMRINKKSDNFGAWKKMPKYGEQEGSWTRYNDKYKPYRSFTTDLAGEDIGAYFSFDLEEETVIEVQIGVSYVSTANARMNLEKELAERSFNNVLKHNQQAWEKLLNRIKVQGGTEEDKIIFYTGLYHLLMHPNILQDVNGDYPEMDGYRTLNTGGKNRYTVFSLWDTYRNVHPFLSLVYPELQSDMLNSMVDIYDESGWLPKWELLSMETGVMVGDPATPVIADSYLRGIQDFDVHKAYAAARKAATRKKGNKLRPRLTEYDSLGYITQDMNNLYSGAVSIALEYNISDYNLAILAKELGKSKDHAFFLERSKSYRNYFDKETGMLRPRVENGKWHSPFDPEQGKNFEAVVGFVEGNAWQYRFYVPHDIPGIMELLGGEKTFISELQKCFDTDNYDMANEPDITYPYLFNYVKGEEWRSQKTVRELIRKYYYNGPAGIPGNDDTGTLSCWLLYSMMGFYPHCPGDMEYTLVSPVFEKVEIQLSSKYYSGKKLIISSPQSQGDEKIYINKILWNGKPVKGYFINHHELVKGGELVYKLKK